MRLLPKTRRGTWALAFAAWLMTSAMGWFVLPQRPLASWPNPGETGLLGFPAGKRTLLGESTVRAEHDGAVKRRLMSWDGDSGDERVLFETTREITTPILSPNGQWVAVSEKVETGHYRTTIVNSATGRLLSVAGNLTYGADRRFTADSRLFVYRQDGYHLHEVMTGTELARVDPDRIGLYARLAALTPDGSEFITHEQERIGADLNNRRAFLRTRSTTNKNIVKSIELSDLSMGIDDQRTGLTPDGRYFAAAYSAWSAPNAIRRGVRGWDLANGRQVCDLNATDAVFPIGASWFAVLRDGPAPRESVVCFIEYATGNEIGRVAAPQGWPDNGRRISIPSHAIGAARPNETFKALAPNARLMVEGRLSIRRESIVREWLASRGLMPFPSTHEDVMTLTLTDPLTRESFGSVSSTVNNGYFGPNQVGFDYCFDGHSFALLHWDKLEVWDIPTRPSLSWLVAWAAVTGLMVAGLAFHRVRYLRTLAANGA